MILRDVEHLWPATRDEERRARFGSVTSFASGNLFSRSSMFLAVFLAALETSLPGVVGFHARELCAG